MATPVSETIYASRDAIRTQVVDFLQQYMELNEVDLTQSSFLSYIIDILTTLSSNLMFYQSNIYKEFFLTQAQLPESIHNLSSFLGYSPTEADYAIVNILMKIWLPFTDPDTTFNIPTGFSFKTNDETTFVTYYDTTITLTDNTSVVISIEKDGKVYDVPVDINTTDDPRYFQFLMPARQYKTIRQEFQVDTDIQLYQFIDKNVPVTGKLADITVYVRGPEDTTTTDGTLYTKFNSLYLMTSSDEGYVVRVSPEGRKLYFGNDIIGKRPKAGSTIIVYTSETLGAAGNVIAGSIVKGDRIYSQQKNTGSSIGVTTLVDYSIINPSPAYGGKDEENLQEIRSNSIKSLVSLGRLVSEQDYKNFDVVIPDAPVKSNSIPVLKRSDLKINEIQLYTIFNFGDELIPSKNISYNIPNETTFIPRNTVIEKDGVDYITLFEMNIDPMNEVAYYNYIIYEIELSPTLIQTWTYPDQDLYHFHTNKLEIINNNDSTASFILSYYSNEIDFDKCVCELKIVSSDIMFTMTNVSDLDNKKGTFTYTFDNYLDIPSGSQLIYFTIYNLYTPPDSISKLQELSQYSANIIFRKDLRSFMISNTLVSTDITTIYDIPVIKKSYYDAITIKRDFEEQVLQEFLTVADFKSYRMLTDFINLKLCNTTGLSKNMLKNTPTRDSIIDIGLTAIPENPLIGDSYIVSGNESGNWTGKRDKIAVCSEIDPDITWTFIEPKSNDIVYITNKASNYIFTEYGWKPPIYDIPLKIYIEVFKVNDSSIGETDLISAIKSAIVDYYESDFGPKLIIRRSKIIDIIHNITGVSHCRLITPESDIFFNFNIDDFEQQELLEYTPEWIYFTEDDIIIKIFTLD